MTLLHTLEESDTAVFRLVQREAQRQEEGLELIASENFASRAVMEAMGSPLTNKYAEGYPRKRYYGGCEVVDEVEQLAIDRAKELFSADHANVQPHAGSQANLTAYLAVLQPGEKLMGMSLTHGGHLTHGHKVNHSGQIFQSVQYGVQESTGLIDMDQVREMAQRERPKLVIAGTSAYPRIVDFPAFAEVARGIDAVFLVDMAHFAGLVAGGHYPNPMEHAHIVTSTTHKTLRGPRGGFILCREEFAKAVDKSVFPGGQGGPLEHVIAAKAVGFGEALQPSFKEYGAQVIRNARKLGEVLAQRGYDLVSGGTDTHLILVDLRAKSFSGKDGEEALGRAGIHVNKNTVPGDQRSPFVTSGLRIGSSALTTRGMGEEEMARIADFIARVLEASDDATIEAVAAEVRELAESFPLYATAPTA
jgi:glycine hydroxymethyltransferase